MKTTSLGRALRGAILPIGLLCAGLPAAALDCDADFQELQEALPGTWRVANTIGVLTVQGRSNVLPQGNSSSAEIRANGLGLELTGGLIKGSYPLEMVARNTLYFDGPARSFREASGAVFIDEPEVLSEDEVALLTGCAEDALPPRLVASGIYQDPDGPVEFELFLFVVSEDLLYGVVHGRLKSRQAEARRITVWSR